MLTVRVNRLTILSVWRNGIDASTASIEPRVAFPIGGALVTGPKELLFTSALVTCAIVITHLNKDRKKPPSFTITHLGEKKKRTMLKDVHYLQFVNPAAVLTRGDVDVRDLDDAIDTDRITHVA